MTVPTRICPKCGCEFIRLALGLDIKNKKFTYRLMCACCRFSGKSEATMKAAFEGWKWFKAGGKL